MSEQSPEKDRSVLPDGFAWAEWSRKAEIQAVWTGMHHKLRAAFIVRFKMVAQTKGNGLPHEIFFWIKGSGGIGKAKVRYDNPGWRGYLFRDGNGFFVATFSPKGDDDTDAQVAVAQVARDEHKRNTRRRTHGTHRPN